MNIDGIRKNVELTRIFHLSKITKLDPINPKNIAKLPTPPINAKKNSIFENILHTSMFKAIKRIMLPLFFLMHFQHDLQILD